MNLIEEISNGSSVNAMTHGEIAMLRKKFLEDGGPVTKYPEYKGWDVGEEVKKLTTITYKNKFSGELWTYEKDMRVNCSSFYRLCPYNAFIVKNFGVTDDYWKRVVEPLKEKERMEELSEEMEIDARYRWS
jgi:hypothetical protein|tara:strand:+ start:92 stop:484 length:393 start_codon:yes stop_codon:yes gene_type:complete